MAFLSSGLGSKNIELHVAFLTKGPDHSIFNNARIRMDHIPCINNYDPRILIRLIIIIMKFKPDLIHSWNPQMDVICGLASKITKTCWVLSERNSEIAAKHRGIKEKWRQVVSKWATHIIANSQSGFDYWKHIRPDINCSIIWNGIPDIGEGKNQLLNRQSNHVKSILFVGRLVPHKNIKYLFLAFAQIVFCYRVKLIICGVGPQKQKLIDYAEELGIGKHIELLGYVGQQKIFRLMRKCTIFVNPSQYEGTPNVVIEAMALGCAIAVSSIPGHHDILNYQSALFFDPNNVNSLAEIFQLMLNEPGTCRNLGRRARSKVKTFTKDFMVQQYKELYESLFNV